MDKHEVYAQMINAQMSGTPEQEKAAIAKWQRCEASDAKQNDWQNEQQAERNYEAHACNAAENPRDEF